MPSREEISNMPVVYSLPGMEEVSVQKDIPYKVADGAELHTTIYAPKDRQSGSRLPAVLFIHGEGPTTTPIRPISIPSETCQNYLMEFPYLHIKRANL